MFNLKRMGAVLATILFLAACSGKSDQQGKVLAKVNGTPLTEQDLMLASQPTGHGLEERKTGLDHLIIEELFYQQGIKLGLDKDPSYQKQLKDLENKGHGSAAKSPGFKRYVANAMREEMARRILNTQIAAKVDVRIADAKQYYEKNKTTISTDLHLGLLKYATKAEADAALKRIHNGESFEAVARAAEIGDKAGTGKEMDKPGAKAVKPSWDLGYLNWNAIPIDFVDTLYRMKPGEVSAVLGSPQGGFQIVKMYGSRPNPGKTDFNTMGTSVMNRLRDLKIIETYNTYVADLKKNAQIETY
ncbi:MAG: peptidyl-prolyl cis-trans isomerase [Geobacteraceae bacterium]|nr:peptidyl-prolyl cis-trans isomerase [Geobacteraceae bacterium]